ncbi:MAG: mechanosensitive ion channel domain-containing protein [Novosphingobium sp.]|uniref:mechanosensitive ion channel family protein n=1 Tax=Novosphingobium sp. TaxID=1874826 RepID=UPI0032BB216A
MSIHKQVAVWTAKLDALGFDIGNYHVSLYWALLVVGVGLGVMVAGRAGNFLVRRLFRRMHRLDPTQQLLGEKLAGVGLWLLLGLLAIDFLGIDLTALAVFSGALGLAIGFGLQKTFGNLISGIIMLMDRSIKPGDVIAVGAGPDKTVGQVNRIGIRAVSVITRDQIEYLIPNELLMTSTVENWSFSTRDVRLKVPVGIAYGSDVALAERLMLQAAHEHPRVHPDPEPSVWLTAFGDSAIQFEIQLWIDDPEAGVGNIRSDVLKRIWGLFGEHGVHLPYPQRDVHIREWPGAPVRDS